MYGSDGTPVSRVCVWTCHLSLHMISRPSAQRSRLSERRFVYSGLDMVAGGAAGGWLLREHWGRLQWFTRQVGRYGAALRLRRRYIALYPPAERSVGAGETRKLMEKVTAGKTRSSLSVLRAGSVPAPLPRN